MLTGSQDMHALIFELKVITARLHRSRRTRRKGTHRIQAVHPMLGHDIEADQALPSKPYEPGFEAGNQA